MKIIVEKGLHWTVWVEEEDGRRLIVFRGEPHAKNIRGNFLGKVKNPGYKWYMNIVDDVFALQKYITVQANWAKIAPSKVTHFVRKMKRYDGKIDMFWAEPVVLGMAYVIKAEYSSELAHSDAIVFVPHHSSELRTICWRGEPTSTEQDDYTRILAEQVSKRLDMPLLSNCVIKKVPLTFKTMKQAERWQRLNPYSQSVYVAGDGISACKDKNIILIDDVLASGATIQSVAKLIRDKGRARSVKVVVGGTVDGKATH